MAKEGFLYLFMIEMKSELSLKELSQCIKKYEHSLNFVITYLAAHPHFQSLTELSIAPVGVLCYNAEDDYHKERDFRNKVILFYNEKTTLLSFHHTHDLRTHFCALFFASYKLCCAQKRNKLRGKYNLSILS